MVHPCHMSLSFKPIFSVKEPIKSQWATTTCHKNSKLTITCNMLTSTICTMHHLAMIPPKKCQQPPWASFLSSTASRLRTIFRSRNAASLLMSNSTRPSNNASSASFRRKSRNNGQLVLSWANAVLYLTCCQTNQLKHQINNHKCITNTTVLIHI